MPTEIEKLDPNFARLPVEDGTRWIDIAHFPLEGSAFTSEANPYTRWPKRAQALLPQAVWDLGQHSAGLSVRFVTNATAVNARWTLTGERLAMDHMPATGVSGLDLYTRHNSRWQWLGVGRPTAFPTNQVPLITNLAPQTREMRLYLPLYNGVSSVQIGIPENALIQPAPATAMRPLCFYGTSIVHGGCASRPGMTYPAIISRALDLPHYNFGFSGNGRSEAAVAHLLAELDPAAYILDPLPNMTVPQVTERIGPFVETLRAARPGTPILLVENIIYRDAYANVVREEQCRSKNAALGVVFQSLLARSPNNLSLVPAEELLGHDGEGTVDGVHPTDLGFSRMAAVIGAAIMSALHE